MHLLVTLLATSVLSQLPQDAKVLDLGDGYSRVVTATYLVELPTGWTSVLKLVGVSARRIQTGPTENSAL